ncbi:MAG: hypothetical protein IJP49_05380 [Bacteroidales bacterium]|nr:hypothetical protein [Bacteroidales bacterium]
MKKWMTLLFAAAMVQTVGAQTLYEGFADPPQEARPRVWWHWMDGNVSMDGIRKDIDWMERAGIGGFHQFDAGGIGVRPIVDELVPYGSPDWRAALGYAMDLADAKGMETAIASAPGWSSTGGPWVKPENAMKKLTWRTMDVSGPSIQILRLPPHFQTPGKYQNLPENSDVSPWFEHIATLAVKLPDAEKTMTAMGAKVSSSGGHFTVEQLTDGDFANAVELPVHPDGFAWIQYSFDRPQMIRAVTLSGCPLRSEWRAEPPGYRNRLEASDDGIVWRKVCDIPDSSLPVMTMDIPATRARHFRLVVKNPEPDNSLARFGIPTRIPTGTAIPEFVLHGVVKVNHAEEKAGFSAPHDFADYLTPDSPDPIVKVQDLSLIDQDGTMIFDIPAGNWRIYRFGVSLTGKKNHPAPPSATGLEVDKLDPEAWETYFKDFFRLYEGMPVQYVLTDSYEAGQMTWTRNMFAEFKARRGYNLLPWLPALAGEIIRSTEETERFLFDWRQTLAELFTENYDRLNDIARQAGMKGRYTESHENGHVYVGDGMDLKRTATVPMSAIWMDDAGDGSSIPMAMADIRESASVAHVYGQNIVAAEAFTTSGVGGKSYSYSPAKMKYTADIALSCGLNRFVIHESSHQPSDSHRPGLDLIGFGQWFNRHETWAEEARAWTDYLARSSYLLQQGKYKADILYYYGEDNSITGLFGHRLPDIPKGYSYDFVNPSGILRSVFPFKEGLITESGMNYRMLVLGPHCRTMSYAVLQRVLYLAQAGVPVCGTVPERAASLTDDQDAFSILALQLQSLMLDMPLAEALAKKGIEPDFIAPDGWAYVHRETEAEDIYWIRNFTGAPASSVILLRAGQGLPHVLDPATGKVRCVNASVTEDGYRLFRLDLEENDALFVVIGKKQEEAIPVVHTHTVPLLTLEGAWNLSFESGMGAPATAVFDPLKSYTESSNPAIRYYSGTVVYRKEFNLSKKQVKDMVSYEIDLGSVKELARVSVNGFDLGVVWKAPFRVEVPAEYIHQGINALEVKVINLWPNRIIGDLQPDAVRTWTYVGSPFYTADSPLLPSGLLGPVTLSGVQ